MLYVSTNKKAPSLNFSQAIFANLAPDGGLYMPEKINTIDSKLLAELSSLSFKELCLEIGEVLLKDSLDKDFLKQTIDNSLTFHAPLLRMSEDLSALELFHGPTCAFKDFAAQFMAKLMVGLRNNQPMTILVATSGDTGSAIAQAFWNLPNVKVCLLYPAGYVSPVQEKQLTSFNNNVTSFKVNGNFDDCQALVKQAFADQKLSHDLGLVSANSINLARLIPQIFYYFSAYAQMPKNNAAVIAVPSGNFGNLTAGLIAKRMGLPVNNFIACTNANDVVPRYLKTGDYSPAMMQHTISNAMDVAKPSNFTRVQFLYENSVEALREDLSGFSYTDEQTKLAIREVFDKYKYIVCPHSAIGYLGLQDGIKVLKSKHDSKKNYHGIFLCTAHPAKFPESVEPIIQQKIKVPDSLAESQNRIGNVHMLNNSFEELKNKLISA